MNSPYRQLPLFAAGKKHLHVIIDTPKGSRNKFAFDEELQLFTLKHVLPEGAVFPFDFGFLPNTLTEDGDPLDVMVLLEAPAFTGCVVEVRLIGALEAEQTKNGKTVRNDRLIAVATASKQHAALKTLKDLPRNLPEEIGRFFRHYNAARDIVFEVTGQVGSKSALELVLRAERNFNQQKKDPEV
jgi:inorganic pyrophosphatase